MDADTPAPAVVLPDLYTAACRYAELGYPVFPLVPNQKNPATEHGLKDATLDIAKIEHWWKLNPRFNVGLRTDGLLVVDIDGADNPWLKDQPERQAELTGAPMSLTPRGGRHIFLRPPTPQRNTTGKLALGVDTRADGGYVVVAPSIVDGKPYRWLNDLDGAPGALPLAPTWLVESLGKAFKLSVPGTTSDIRLDNLTRTTLMFLQFGAEQEQRNIRLFSAAADMKANGVPRTKTDELLIPVARRIGLDDKEIDRTIGSAYSADREAKYVGEVKEITQDQLDAAFGNGAATAFKAAPKPRPSIRVRLANAETNWIKTPDGDNVPSLRYRRIDDIAESLRGLTGGWPKICNGLAFACNVEPGVPIQRTSAVRYLTKTNELFAWVGERADLFWTKSASVRDNDGNQATPPTKEEFHAHLRDAGKDRFISVSALPHHPPMPGIYYLPTELPPSDGSALAGFLAGLNPETPDDLELMKACILTGLWGGSCGQRPAFVFSSKHGRGSGKTATALAIAEIFGGAFVIGPKEQWEQVGKRILSDSALNQRVVLRDNVKTKISGEEIESLITLPHISGWRPYHGHFSRPNNLMVLMTANTPRMGNDMAVRSVSIEIGDHRHGRDFMAWYREYVAEHRAAIIADCMAILAGQDQGKIDPERMDRWSEWQRGPLQKCKDPDRLAQLIQDRREDVDSESEEAEQVAEAIRQWVVLRKPERDQDGTVRITRDQMHALLIESKAFPSDMGKRGVYTALCNMLGTHGALASLKDSPGRSYGRCWLWCEPEEMPPI